MLENFVEERIRHLVRQDQQPLAAIEVTVERFEHFGGFPIECRHTKRLLEVAAADVYRVEVAQIRCNAACECRDLSTWFHAAQQRMDSAARGLVEVKEVGVETQVEEAVLALAHFRPPGKP